MDCMGSDNAPGVNIQGSVEAARENGLEVLLVGDRALIEQELGRYDVTGLGITVEHAAEVVQMDESPTIALRKKKDSSINRAVQLVRDKRAEAVVSAGNTGAAMAAAMVFLNTLPMVDRPAIATPMPTPSGTSILLDSGANIDCKPYHLCQFAIMGEVYCRCLLDKEKPSIGLLSNGEEEAKGNGLIKETHGLLKQMPLNFIGNIEGGGIFRGDADVVVCDGFVGNIVLKSSEGLAEVLESSLQEELLRGKVNRLGLLLIKASYRRFRKKVDYAERGGAPLLGVNGVCIIAHGRSSAKAVRNAIGVAAKLVRYRINEQIAEALREFNFPRNNSN